MKITELKIRNFVKYKNEVYTLTELFQPGGSGYFVKIKNQHKSFCLPANKIKPVKLNESWLQQLGFVKTYQSEQIIRYESPGELMKFDIDFHDAHCMGGLKIYGNTVNCTYVHQLQNIFAFLFGKEAV